MSGNGELKGQRSVTHLSMEMANQVQQLLHAPLKGREVTAWLGPQSQSVCVQPWEVAKHPCVRRNLLYGLSPFVRLCVRLSPAVK